VLKSAGHLLMDGASAAWEHASIQSAEALGERASRVAGSVTSQLAVGAQAAASFASLKDSSGP